ncbi:hypothetical protein [Romboutsia sp.]|uniref:hypothetical protein n=1 Tax=Romboutsia sp. TaxID=1965302 RepID=UPI003F37A181
MGLEDLTVSVFRGLKPSKVNNEKLLESFNKTVNSSIMKVLFEALTLCVIQGGFSFNQYFETYTSWMYIPKLCFIPFHVMSKETYLNSSEMHTNTQEILTFKQKMQEKYEDIDPNSLNDNLQTVLNLNTETIPQKGIAEYKNFLTIEAEYWMRDENYIIDTQFLKVGFPNILKFLRCALDSLPYDIPVYFYSEKSGGISLPWIATRIIPASIGTTNKKKIDSKQVYTLHKFQYDTNSKNDKITFHITLLSSMFGLYSSDNGSAKDSSSKNNQANEKAGSTIVS